MGLNLNWMDDEDYLNTVNNKDRATELLRRVKERQSKEKAHWEDRKIRGFPVKVRVIDQKCV